MRRRRGIARIFMAHHIDHNCSGCRACVGTCPTGAIQGDGCAPHVIDPARCIDCGVCGGLCPDSAVRDERGEACVAHHPSRLRAWVDVRACTGCGDCVTACAFDAIERVVVETSRFAPRVVGARCLACGACEVACLQGAIAVRREAPSARLRVLR